MALVISEVNKSINLLHSQQTVLLFFKVSGRAEIHRTVFETPFESNLT